MNSVTPPPAKYRRDGGVRAAALAVLAFPWAVHAAVVGLSACSFRPLAGSALPSAVLLAGGVASAGAWAWATRRDVPAVGEQGPAPVAALAAVIGVAGALAFGWALLAALAFPVVAYDALGYRIPAIASWLDEGRIAWVVTDDPVRNGYPLGQEAVAAVLAAATGSLRLTAAASFPFVAAGALALVALAEECGVRRPLAWAAGGLFLLVPMIPLNAASGYVDASFAGAMIALVSFAASMSGAPDDDVAALGAGMAGAHVLALKGNGVVFAGLVFAALLARAVFARMWPRRLPVAVGVALPGAFWLARNVIRTGNPFWPVRMEAGGRVIFPGVASLESVLDIAHNTPPELLRLSAPVRVIRTWLELGGPAFDFDARLSGMGLTWVLVALPALGFALFARRPDPSAGVRSKLGFVTAVTAVCFAIQPLNWWARYTLWLWGAGALGVVVTAESLLRRGAPRAVGAILAVAALLSISEGAWAAAHANGAHTALQALGPGAFLAPGDAKRPVNVRRWVHSTFWAMHWENDHIVCRGYWKPNTDDANLDGVFAQLVPRLRIHVINDETLAWPAVRRAYQEKGCSRLLLFARSPVLRDARNDDAVSVEEVVAFDPLFVVRAREPRVSSNLE